MHLKEASHSKGGMYCVVLFLPATDEYDKKIEVNDYGHREL